MTTQILELIEDHRKFKNEDRAKYKQIHPTKKEEIRMAKEWCMEERYEELEHLQQKHDGKSMHKKIKYIFARIS